MTTAVDDFQVICVSLRVYLHASGSLLLSGGWIHCLSRWLGGLTLGSSRLGFCLRSAGSVAGLRRTCLCLGLGIASRGCLLALGAAESTCFSKKVSPFFMVFNHRRTRSVEAYFLTAFNAAWATELANYLNDAFTIPWSPDQFESRFPTPCGPAV
jgi:hypothetical protein